MAIWVFRACDSRPRSVLTAATPVSSHELSKPRMIMAGSLHLVRKWRLYRPLLINPRGPGNAREAIQIARTRYESPYRDRGRPDAFPDVVLHHLRTPGHTVAERHGPQCRLCLHMPVRRARLETRS